MGIILVCCKESQSMFPDTPFLSKEVETYKQKKIVKNVDFQGHWGFMVGTLGNGEC